MAMDELGKDNQPADEREELRLTVLRAADELLEGQGLDGLTIRAVLDRTGLARRAFYDLFATKDDLVLSLFEHTVANAAQLLASEGRKLPGPVERLRLIVFAIVEGQTVVGSSDTDEHDRRSAAFSREHLRLAEARPKDLHRAIAPLVALITRQVEDGVSLGQLASHSPERSARFVYNLISTTVHTETLRPRGQQMAPGTRRALAEDLWGFCYRALSA